MCVVYCLDILGNDDILDYHRAEFLSRAILPDESRFIHMYIYSISHTRVASINSRRYAQ